MKFPIKKRWVALAATVLVISSIVDWTVIDTQRVKLVIIERFRG